MPSAILTAPVKSDRASLLHAIGRNYVLRGIGGKNFDAIPYSDDVELRAPFAPGGVNQPLVGREKLRTVWWPPLPQLVAGVELIGTFVDEELSAVTAEFHCRITQPACTLRIMDRFTVDDAGRITAQENFLDPRNVTTPGWEKGTRSTTIHHLALACSDFARSKAFYTAVLKGLGYTLAMEADGFAGYVKDGLLLVLRGAEPGTAHVHGGCGLHHLAFAVSSRAAVDEFYRNVLLKLPSVEIEDPPVECPEIMPGFYATFFFDPDGIKLEVTFTP
jgi:catechol 2,3-dioxygenase-like lactoylglutathione lyase family enzyme